MLNIRRHIALVALVAAGLLWGLTVPLSKLVLDWLDGGTLTVVRFALAAPLLAFFARKHLKAAFTPRILAAGAIGYGLVIVLQNAGIERTSVSHAALIVGATPALVALTAAASVAAVLAIRAADRADRERDRAPAPPREQRSVHAIPTNAELKMARALDLFNASAHPRTVAGVARSLGSPIVAVRPSATEGSVVTIVVAWELSWYRFEVDLANEPAGVRVAAQGSELSELDTIDQTPNAAADDGGRLHPAASLA
jgi:hypothetical protein